MDRPRYQLPPLPPPVDLETPVVLKAAAEAHRHLAELKGRSVSVPNPLILIDTLILQEARASCHIEDIVTSQDELFQSSLFPENMLSPAAKDVVSCGAALKERFDGMQELQGLITNNLLITIYRRVKSRTDGFRVTPGTVLRHTGTGEPDYGPPQDGREIVEKMGELERFINCDAASSLDPLVRMAVIHHQFESIHPFADGNGRVGRILNVLYLVRCNLLEMPILYLSRAITRSKEDYYRCLQGVRDQNAWEAWLTYMLASIVETSQHTLGLVKGIGDLMAQYKHKIRAELPRIYSQDLLNSIFRQPYTTIAFARIHLGVTRQTAARRLDLLADRGFLRKHRSGRFKYFVNEPLVALLLDADGDSRA